MVPSMRLQALTSRSDLEFAAGRKAQNGRCPIAEAPAMTSAIATVLQSFSCYQRLVEGWTLDTSMQIIVLPVRTIVNDPNG